MFGTDLGGAIEVRDATTGKLRQELDTSWLLADADVETLMFGGRIAMAAAGDRVAIFVADSPRVGFVTLSTGAHARVDVAACP